jgi:hypothetical protein
MLSSIAENYLSSASALVYLAVLTVLAYFRLDVFVTGIVRLIIPPSGTSTGAMLPALLAPALASSSSSRIFMLLVSQKIHCLKSVHCPQYILGYAF